MSVTFNQSNRWITEAVFIFSGLMAGVALELQFFTMTWNPYQSSLQDFAFNGAWDKAQMANRMLITPIIMVGIFYLLNLGIRAALFRKPLFKTIETKYKKVDKLLYSVFLLALLGFFGIYMDLAVLAIVFFLAQIVLIYKLVDFKNNKLISGTLLENRLLLLLFLCSGFAALIYQIVWQRSLFQAFGVNIESVTIIVSLFMLGLGVGSLAGGLLSRKFPNHLPLLFVICEVIIGTFGIFSLPLIGIVTQATVHSSLFTISIATYALLFLPTLFMGATLPILVSYLYRAYHNVGKSLSILYFINTLGSAIACFITAFLIFLYTGLTMATYIAAFINFAVAVFGYKYIRVRPNVEPQVQPVSTAHSSGNQEKYRYYVILFISLAVGFVSLSQEILWVRLVAFSSSGFSTVFPLVLGFFLIGIALGSLKANKICEKDKDKVLNTIALFIIFSSLAYYLLIPVVAKMIGVIGLLGLLLLLLGISGIAFLTGAVLPMLSYYAIRSYAHVGFSISWVYFFNIVGSVAGSLFTGFFLLNWFTIQQVILFISILYCVFGCGLWIISRRDNPYSTAKVASVAVAGLVMFLAHDFLYFDLLERLYHKHAYAKNTSFKYEEQSRHGIINVIGQETGGDVIIGGGAYDGRFSTDLVNDTNGINRVYMFPVLHKNPKRVLVIGLSSGSWASVITNYKDVQAIDIVEINESYSDIIQHYTDQRSVLEDKRVRVFYDDGRRWLKRNPAEKYDFILMNTTYYWRNQANNLVSKEFLEMCKLHLNPGGVVHYNATSSWDIPYTAAHVFKQVTMYGSFVAGSDTPFPNKYEDKMENLLKFTYQGRPIAEHDDAKLTQVLEEMATHDLRNRRSEFLAMDQVHLITDDNLASEFKTKRKFYAPSSRWSQLLGMQTLEAKVARSDRRSTKSTQ